MAGKKVNRLIVPNTYYVDGMAPVTSVNNILPVNGNVTLPIPTVPTNVSAFTNDAGYLTSVSLNGYATQSWVQQQGYLTSVPSQYITDTELSTTLADYVLSSSLATVATTGAYSDLTGTPTIPTDTSDLTNNAGFITSAALSGYATETWVGQQGYLTSIPSSYLQNNATGTNALAVGKISQSTAEGGVAIGYDARANSTYSTAVGEDTRATNTNTTVIGRAAKATQARAIAIGSGAEANAQDAIAIKGINNTANTFQVYTYNMLDMSTGLIPDARISSNIARVTDIPDVSNFVTSSSLATTLADYTLSSSLATVATSGSYSDLSNKPTIPAAQVQSDWNQTDNTAVDFIKNKPTIPSGVVVDQTYDGTSTNAQSGVAIAGAGFLTSIPSGYLQNTATGSNSLTIFGTATSNTRATNIGYGSIASDYATALGNNAEASSYGVALGSNAEASDYAVALGPSATASSTAVALGSSATANGDFATTLGYNADASGNSAIQLGYGLNSTANTLSVGFYNDSNTHYNWQLLDGTTGLIPDARIGTNIARTSQLPTVPTNISSFTNDSGYQTSGDVNTIVTSAISTLLSNIYPIGSVYIGTQAICPLATLISGSTWELVAADRVLQGSSANHAANTTVAAGLPNITGTASGSRDANSTKTGAFSGSTFTTSQYIGHSAVSGYAYYLYKFDASDSNTIYGNSTTVQPPAYVVNIWRRTA